MEEDMPKIRKDYFLEDKHIQVIGEVRKNENGRFVLHFKHRIPKYPKEVWNELQADKVFGTRTYDYEQAGGPWKKDEIPLNSPGRNKMEKSLLNYLRWQYFR
jgi:hypothetical protein